MTRSAVQLHGSTYQSPAPFLISLDLVQRSPPALPQIIINTHNSTLFHNPHYSPLQLLLRHPPLLLLPTKTIMYPGVYFRMVLSPCHLPIAALTTLSTTPTILMAFTATDLHKRTYCNHHPSNHSSPYPKKMWQVATFLYLSEKMTQSRLCAPRPLTWTVARLENTPKDFVKHL